MHTLDGARAAAGAHDALMVIGGAEIYRQCLPLAGRIHLTLIHTCIHGRRHIFHGLARSGWVQSSCERHEADDKNAYAYSFITLERGPNPRASAERRQPDADLPLRAREIDVREARDANPRSIHRAAATAGVPRSSAV